MKELIFLLTSLINGNCTFSLLLEFPFAISSTAFNIWVKKNQISQSFSNIIFSLNANWHSLTIIVTYNRLKNRLANLRIDGKRVQIAYRKPMSVYELVWIFFCLYNGGNRHLEIVEPPEIIRKFKPIDPRDTRLVCLELKIGNVDLFTYSNNSVSCRAHLKVHHRHLIIFDRLKDVNKCYEWLKTKL